MKEIINIIFKRNSENQIVPPEDIIRITNILESIYEIDFNVVKFKCGEVNSIYYIL